MTHPVLAGLLAAALAAAPCPARAEAASVRVRGTVIGAEADALTVRGPGAAVRVRMNPRTRVLAATDGRLRDIKAESYLSVLTGPEPRRAERVAIYAPSERGFEAGRRPWDTGPGASLTAGWVADLAGTEARRVTLAHGDDRSAFDIPAGTPVVLVGPGERALLVPGAAVTVLARPAPDGAPEAETVAVGRLGAVPAL